ncbi:hypothetical protein FY034_17620 (plasmid) [Trichlorobacter lovleyi]|uniref:hypothetical protein n=1 Tax=Trichlorobacter lovleyi TaxID=313985 RepID=UPI0022403575|nr:hypothetical protein [Trichlorobacter lovleyi]QOX80843.1 hypothetical protein FY034_17620 [Trichlorobacter lovleyi]
MSESKKETLERLARRTFQLVRLEKLEAPENIIQHQKQMLNETIGSKEINIGTDQNLIRQFFMHHAAMMIANDYFARIGAMGNDCLDCAHTDSCSETEEVQESVIDHTRTCNSFVRAIRASEAQEIESSFLAVDGYYGIDAHRDIHEVREIVKTMISERNTAIRPPV